MKGNWCPYLITKFCQEHAGCSGCWIFQHFELNHRPAIMAKCKRESCTGCDAWARCKRYTELKERMEQKQAMAARN